MTDGNCICLKSIRRRRVVRFGCNANPVALLVPPAAPKGFREENFAPTDSDTNTIPREEKTRGQE